MNVLASPIFEGHHVPGPGVDTKEAAKSLWNVVMPKVVTRFQWSKERV